MERLVKLALALASDRIDLMRAHGRARAIHLGLLSVFGLIAVVYLLALATLLLADAIGLAGALGVVFGLATLGCGITLLAMRREGARHRARLAAQEAEQKAVLKSVTRAMLIASLPGIRTRPALGALAVLAAILVMTRRRGKGGGPGDPDQKGAG